ncbi:MAG: ROK family protein [Lachnospiraceae bacterium]|nr:ROK family protein [Lachnospiraceae bacterium]
MIQSGRNKYGALEAGGTKMVCAVGYDDGRILEKVSIPTLEPDKTIPEIIGFFRDKNISALGVASFGPVDLDKTSPTYGYITSTPKKGWGNYPLVSALKEALNVPVGFDTDVNGALLGEVTFGSSKGITDAIYITIGTGIGGGVMTNGKLLHGMMHPELGHMLLRPEEDDKFKGVCPFHGNCFEGLASGPAIEKRWGEKAEKLYDRDEVWELEAFYIGQAIANLIMTLSPKRIILGGGVMHQSKLFPLIREAVKKNLNGYIRTPLLEKLDEYIVTASLGDDQGIMGCIKLAAGEM